MSTDRRFLLHGKEMLSESWLERRERLSTVLRSDPRVMGRGEEKNMYTMLLYRRVSPTNVISNAM